MTDTVVNKSNEGPQQAATLSEGIWFKTLNPLGKESSIDLYKENTRRRTDRTLQAQFPYWLQQNLNPIEGWVDATFEILFGTHFQTGNPHGFSKGVLDLFILPLISRLWFSRQEFQNTLPTQKTPILNALSVIAAYLIEMLRGTLGISLWISLFPVVMAFHMVKDVVDVLRYTEWRDLKALLPWEKTPLRSNPEAEDWKDTFVMDEIPKLFWDKNHSFLDAVKTTFYLLNGYKLSQTQGLRAKGLLDWLFIFRIGQKLLADIKEEQRSHTWFFNFFAYIVGNTLKAIQYALSGVLTALSIPFIFLVRLVKEILVVCDTEFTPFFSSVTFDGNLLNAGALEDEFLNCFKILYGSSSETSQYLGVVHFLLLGFPLISDFLKKRFIESNARGIATPILTVFYHCGIIPIEIPRWIAAVSLFVVSIPMVILARLIKEIYTIYKNGMDANTFPSFFITEKGSKNVIDVFLNFITKDWTNFCKLFNLLVGTHYDKDSYTKGPRAQGLLDFLLLGLPLLSQKLIRDTYKDERSNTSLLNIAAWTLALPIEIIRFTVGASLTVASYIPILVLTFFIGGAVGLGMEIATCCAEPEDEEVCHSPTLGSS